MEGRAKMDNLLTILTPIIIAIGAVCAFALARREKTRKNDKLNRRDYVVRSTYTWGVIMITIDVLLLTLLIFGNIDDPFPIGFNIVMGAVALLLGYGILQSFRENVRIVERNEIIYTPTVGKKRKYTFDDIERVEKRKTGIYVYVGGKKAFGIDPSGIGTSLFVEMYRDFRNKE